MKITAILVQLCLQTKEDNRALFHSEGYKLNEIKSHMPEILEFSMCATKRKNVLPVLI